MAGIILVYLLLLLSPLIVEQGRTITAAMPGYYQTLREWMVNSPNQLMVRLGEFLPATPPSLTLGTTQQSGEDVMASAGQVLGYITLAAQLFFTAIVTLMLAFYWTLDWTRTIHAWWVVHIHKILKTKNDCI